MDKIKLFITLSASLVIIGSSIYILINGLPESMIMPHALINLIAGLVLTGQVILK